MRRSYVKRVIQFSKAKCHCACDAHPLDVCSVSVVGVLDARGGGLRPAERGRRPDGGVGRVRAGEARRAHGPVRGRPHQRYGRRHRRHVATCRTVHVVRMFVMHVLVDQGHIIETAVTVATVYVGAGRF